VQLVIELVGIGSHEQSFVFNVSNLYLIDTLLVLLRRTRTVLFCVCKVSLQSFDIMPPKSLLSIMTVPEMLKNGLTLAWYDITYPSSEVWNILIAPWMMVHPSKLWMFCDVTNSSPTLPGHSKSPRQPQHIMQLQLHGNGNGINLQKTQGVAHGNSNKISIDTHG